MLSRRIALARPLTRALRPGILLPRTTFIQRKYGSKTDGVDPSLADPDLNGGYVNPPAIKRQHRDPYADWWDPVERRNFGEPVHEDNDVLNIFTPHDYDHFSFGWSVVLVSTFVGSIFALCGVVYMYYPDIPAIPRSFPGGLDIELGGAGALRARKEDDPLD
ncbi:hypothetical protein M501DRAFT_1003818 [Patellaria atrata CBS 101060]|uniref:Uncharacterized protein n=1 Tax=Patellaria atrata CBS 101060 TaxID=1346257 RepID=A0A9P4SCS9_9PEZI|nr:hypothetical protein M501DRAFT_1003818 [Patellaria atrata CBS 101060]